MGYRHYFYKVKKQDVEEVKSFTPEEVISYCEEHGVEVERTSTGSWFYFNDKKFLNKVELHCLGKLYWDDTADRIYDKGNPLFGNKEVQEMVSDYVPYVVGKEGVLEAIEVYKEKVYASYERLLVDGKYKRFITKDDLKSIDEVADFIDDRLMYLPHLANTDLEDKWSVSNSWLYEHAIFDLIHILKTVDWETETVLFYGW